VSEVFGDGLDGHAVVAQHVQVGGHDDVVGPGGDRRDVLDGGAGLAASSVLWRGTSQGRTQNSSRGVKQFAATIWRACALDR
jgi:hypothetical protein